MNGLTLLAVGSLILGTTVAYALWVKVRVWMLRQDFFAIRDRLWDEMMDRGEVNADVHRWYREVINEMIRFAPALSWGMVYLLLRHEREITPADKSRRFDPAEYPEPVARAARDVEQCVLRYLFRWSPLGWLIYAGARARGTLDRFQRRLADIVKRVSRSNQVEVLAGSPAVIS